MASAMSIEELMKHFPIDGVLNKFAAKISYEGLVDEKGETGAMLTIEAIEAIVTIKETIWRLQQTPEFRLQLAIGKLQEIV